MNAVITENLTKIYSQNKKAVDSINLTLKPGEIFGFLGPNGAGKTTAVKLLNGMLQPTQGSSLIFGLDPALAPEKVHQLSGVVTEHAQMYDHMTALQNLIFYGTSFGGNTNDVKLYAKSLLEKLELSEASDQKLATYSTGMRQRLSLARAMIHRPQILFLDEPTSGLDPENIQNVNSMIKKLAMDEGITVFLCTHQLRYAQEICNTYGLIDDGVMLAGGSLDELRDLVYSGMTVTLKTDYIPENIPCSVTGNQTIEIRVKSETEIASIVKHIVDRGGNIYHVTSHKLSLEDIYFSLLEKRKERGE